MHLTNQDGPPRKSREDVSYQYYLVGFVDVLGQKDEFGGLYGLPRTKEDEARIIEVLKRTVGFIRMFRRSLQGFFDALTQPSELSKLMPPEKVELFKEMRRVEVNFQGFSDFIEIHVSFRNDGNFCPVMNGVFGAMAGLGAMSLASLAARHVLRGAVEVGTGVELESGEIYGPALNAAYLLESQEARYPRILAGKGLIDFLDEAIAQKVVDEFSGYCRTMATLCKGMVSNDFDERPILDYLGAGFMRAFTNVRHEDGKNTSETISDLVQRAKAFVNEQFSLWREEGKSENFEKFNYLRKYFERKMDPAQDEARADAFHGLE